MTATPTTSNGSPQVLSAVGPSLPVVVTLDAQQATLPPGIFTSPSPDANLRAIFEVTGDQPDAYGNLSASATWVPYTPQGFSNTSGYIDGPMGAGLVVIGATSGQPTVSKLDVTITAIRVRILQYVAGSLTFVVAQNNIPKLHGGF